MKISERDKKLLIYLCSGLLLLVAYFFGYTKYSEKKAVVQLEIDQLNTRYNDLKAKDDKRASYIAETEKNTSIINETAKLYPSEVTLEGEIYFTKLIEDASGAWVRQWLYTQAEEVLPLSASDTTPNDTTQGEGTTSEGATGGQTTSETIVPTTFKGYKTVSTISFDADYNQLKNMINYINTYASRKVIQQISVAFDSSTGILTGTMAYNNYFIVGSTSTYTPYEIPSNGQGVTNVFGQMVQKPE